MEAQQESSDINNEENIVMTTMDPNFDSDIVDSPIVTSLTTPYPQASGSVRTHVASLRKIQEQEQEIRKQQRKIQELEFSIAIQDAHTQNIKASDKIPNTPSAPTETPGPHRLQMKPERPEDVAYRTRLEEQSSAEKAMGQREDGYLKTVLL